MGKTANLAAGAGGRWRSSGPFQAVHVRCRNIGTGAWSRTFRPPGVSGAEVSTNPPGVHRRGIIDGQAARPRSCRRRGTQQDAPAGPGHRMIDRRQPGCREIAMLLRLPDVVPRLAGHAGTLVSAARVTRWQEGCRQRCWPQDAGSKTMLAAAAPRRLERAVVHRPDEHRSVRMTQDSCATAVSVSPICPRFRTVGCDPELALNGVVSDNRSARGAYHSSCVLRVLLDCRSDCWRRLSSAIRSHGGDQQGFNAGDHLIGFSSNRI
jgi:hypothetical protein